MHSGHFMLLHKFGNLFVVPRDVRAMVLEGCDESVAGKRTVDVSGGW